MRTFTDCPFGSGERLDHEVVGPGSKSLTNPLTALVRPVDLHLGALEIHRAEIVLDRRAFRKVETHGESPATAATQSASLNGVGVQFLVGELRGLVDIFRPASFAAPAGKYPRCWAPRRACGAAQTAFRGGTEFVRCRDRHPTRCSRLHCRRGERRCRATDCKSPAAARSSA